MAGIRFRNLLKFLTLPVRLIRLLVLSLLTISALSSCGVSSSSSNLAIRGACAPLPAASAPNFEPRLEAFMNNLCYRRQHWEHDPQVRTSDGVHPYVKVWYSPSLWHWITVDKRQGNPPDGAMIVKEQYKTLTAPLSEWTIMVKDSKGSWDGWYWADLSYPTGSATITFNPHPPDGCAEPQVSYVGYGLGTCVNCHASAENDTGTYATSAHVLAGMQAMNAYAPPILDNITQRNASTPLIAPPARPEAQSAPRFITQIAASVFKNLRELRSAHTASPPCMVPEGFDHVVAGPPPAGPEEFLTSDQCSGCHDATGTLSGSGRPDIPSMLYPDALSPQVNVSSYGELHYSMMGLAGRDPVFFAQLNSESTLHDNLVTHPHDAVAFVQDTCLSCHGVMGERQNAIDSGGTTLLVRAQLQDPASKYGALARDGVSCDVCHHIAATGLGTPSTFTGRFKVGPADEIYGPYNDPITYPMKSALGIKPVGASQLTSSAMCGSCHTIMLPIFDSQGNPVMENGQPKLSDEQTTYLEWLNSSFNPDQTCQNCHMPVKYDNVDLAFKIANIEDDTFPSIEFRAPDPDITMQVRQPYARHTLSGINLFVLEMFGQFRRDLGLYAQDPNLPAAAAEVISSQQTAIDSALAVAAQTATIKILTAQISSGTLQADVRVTNLAGHDFPTGVGFRRAFIDFQVLDAGGDVLWESGKTNSAGVIVDGAGNPLTTEFFTPTQQTFQPHYWTGNPITREDQVQIYEELVRDPQGQLTTSFFSLDTIVKNNRLQPQGWSPIGLYADATEPVGTGADPDYSNGSGSNTVRYLIPIAGATAGAASIRATLYYQSIPPYYLAQRGEDASGPDTTRLVNYVSELKVVGTPIDYWRLAIASASALIN